MFTWKMVVKTVSLCVCVCVCVCVCDCYTACWLAAQCIVIVPVCVCVCLWRAGGVCCHDNPKLRASIFTKLGL